MIERSDSTYWELGLEFNSRNPFLKRQVMVEFLINHGINQMVPEANGPCGKILLLEQRLALIRQSVEERLRPLIPFYLLVLFIEQPGKLLL